MEIFKGQNLLNLVKELPDDESCKAYLSKIKWSNGFTCVKCGHQKGCLKTNHSYYCYNCEHVESSTANTLFHKVKFGLQKAFMIVFEMTTSTKSISSIQMGKRYGISQPTAWGFMHKVRIAMQSSEQYPMTETVHVDEFVVGGYEQGKPGRSYDSKKTKAVIAVELNTQSKVKRAYVKCIDDYSAKSLTTIFEQHISQDANVVTDKWRGYNPLKKKYNITQKESDKGANFKELHVIIHQLKSWIRTVPSHIHKKYIQAYFNEFVYRLNRSLFKETIFHNTIVKMVKAKPTSLNMINGS
ncbi:MULTISPECIES: IS1595-like element ISMyr1 family transposase [Myroides]|nr:MULTISPECIES: IS1595-like element ISMyr1 family transposase [Myroides]AJA70705.1 Transposase zinc-ribbon domain/ISXO2-like transposase domain [Myroides sp. A21]MDM1370372.1 IS1595-like element ISMyr1 family transposase [Myroides marinus]